MALALTEQTADTLTGDDLKALRAATWVSAFAGTDGSARLHASKTITVDGFEHNATRDVRVSATLTAYDGQGVGRRCYAHLAGPAFETVLSLLRVGDSVALRWVAGNDNENLREARLHADELYFTIVRGDRRLTFLVDYQVNPQNTARMVGGGL